MRWRSRLAALFLGVVLAGLTSEIVCRLVFRGTPYLPGPEIHWIQSHLTAHPQLGFLWQPNLRERDDVLISWRDADPFLLTTDADGFLNTPEAIEARRRGQPIDIVGLGDSFIHDAAETFRGTFAAAGLAYYSLAMHRHSPPQYNRILEQYALALRPTWALYGISEHDYADITDFQAWERSGLDWFQYHSGTWCGPPRSTLGWGSFAPGIYSGWRTAVMHAGRFARRAGPELTRAVAEIAGYAVSAHRAAEAGGIQLLVLLIPSKQTALRGAYSSPNAHDELYSLLRAAGVSVLDLRGSFRDHPDSGNLFYKLDGHWNRAGMRVASSEIRAQFEAPAQARSPDHPVQ